MELVGKLVGLVLLDLLARAYKLQDPELRRRFIRKGRVDRTPGEALTDPIGSGARRRNQRNHPRRRPRATEHPAPIGPGISRSARLELVPSCPYLGGRHPNPRTRVPPAARILCNFFPKCAWRRQNCHTPYLELGMWVHHHPCSAAGPHSGGHEKAPRATVYRLKPYRRKLEVVSSPPLTDPPADRYAYRTRQLTERPQAYPARSSAKSADLAVRAHERRCIKHEAGPTRRGAVRSVGGR